MMSDDATFYYALKAADAALDPPVPDPAEVAAALRDKTETLFNQMFRWKDAKRIAREAGDWPKIVLRSRQTTPDNPAVLAAINAVESADEDMIDPTSQVWQFGTQALIASHDLAQATLDAINRLGTVTRRILARDPTAADVVAAREQY